MFVPMWIIAVVAAVVWLATGIGMTKLWGKLIDADVSYEAPFLVIFWPMLLIGIPFFLLGKLTDRIFAN